MTEDKVTELAEIILKSLGGDRQHKQLAWKIANNCEDFIDNEIAEVNQGWKESINRS